MKLQETFGLSADGTLTGDGPTARRERVRNDPRMRDAVVEAKQLGDKAKKGDRYSILQLNEAITTSDLFKTAYGEVLDRETLTAYEDIETQWTKVAARTTVKDFKAKPLHEFGRNRHGLRRVPEHTNYPIASVENDERTISVGKFGEQYGYTFEARVNDDIGELDQVPAGWATQARYTEDDAVTSLLANPLTGAPNPVFFNADNGNLGTGALTVENLQAALENLADTRDKDGRLLRSGPLQLVVGRGLEFTAARIMNTAEIQTTNDDGTVTKEANPFAGRISLVVLETLPGSAWFIIPTPNAPRPALYLAFLRGFETPDTRYKADQGRAVGGGDIGVDGGSFNDDTIWYRVRHILGAAHGDPTFTFASDGQDGP